MYLPGVSGCLKRAFLPAIALICGGLAAAPAQSDEAARTIAVAHIEAGTLAAGDRELSALLERDAGNDEARFGLGMIRFLAAVEHLSQGLYRYGLLPPGSVLMPVVRLPVPPNASADRITYADFQALIDAFVADLAKADATLSGIGTSEVKIALDLAKIRYDVNGDGTSAPDELFAEVLARVAGINLGSMVGPTVVAFDRGDAYWLQGYCHVLMAFGEFLLGYDWHESFDASFHVFFPKANLALAAALDVSENPIAAEPLVDLVSFIHIPWRVAEPDRIRGVRDHLKTVVALSRKSWDAIEAETDNDREWVPNSHQTGVITALRVDGERIAAWRTMLDAADELLDGRKLVPHWRLRKGINLRRVFDDPRAFDLVLWITGPAALSYLEDGTVMTREDWLRMVRTFGSNFGSYAIWFN